jgi:Terminase small subunit
LACEFHSDDVCLGEAGWCLMAGPRKKDTKLSPKRQRFVDEYLVDYNASAAWIRAGYSAKSAGSSANHALKEPLVIAAIEEARKALSERTGVTQDEVRRELKSLAFAERGKVKDADKIRSLQLLGLDLGMFKEDGVTVPVTIVFDDPTERPEGYQRKKHINGDGESEH